MHQLVVTEQSNVLGSATADPDTENEEPDATENRQDSGGMVDRSHQSRRPSSQERNVRSLVLDTRYNRLLLVKSTMLEAEAIKNGVVRTNSLPSNRRRSRFRCVSAHLV